MSYLPPCQHCLDFRKGAPCVARAFGYPERCLRQTGQGSFRGRNALALLIMLLIMLLLACIPALPARAPERPAKDARICQNYRFDAGLLGYRINGMEKFCTEGDSK